MACNIYTCAYEQNLQLGRTQGPPQDNRPGVCASIEADSSNCKRNALAQESPS